MPALYGKVHMFFGGAKWGWDEEWYWSSTNASVSGLLGDSKGLVAARRGVMSDDWAVEAVRVTVTNDTGATFLAGASNVGYESVGGGPGMMEGGCANPWLAFLLSASTADAKYRRNVYLRGIDAELLCMGAEYQVPFPVSDKLRGPLTAYNNYVLAAQGAKFGDTVRAGAFQMRAKDLVNGRGQAVEITAVSVAEDGHWTITTDTPIQILESGVLTDAGLGDVIHVYGPRAPWARGLSGDHTIINPFIVDSTTYRLSGRQKRACTVDYLQDALACGVNYILVKPDSIDPSRPVKRSTGKPFFGTRGRRSKVGC